MTPSRKTLLKNNLKTEDIVINNFNDKSDWAVTGTGARCEDSTEYFKTGTQSLKVTTTTTYPGTQLTLEITPTSFNNKNILGLRCYVPPLSVPDGLLIDISSKSNFSKYFEKSVTLGSGWNLVLIDPLTWTAYNGETWSNEIIKINIKVLSKANQTGEVYFDSLFRRERGHAKCVICFDDAHFTVYYNAYEYMKIKNVPGTVYMVSDYVDANGGLTSNEIIEMYENGWTIGNHTKSHAILPNLDYDGEIEAIELCGDWGETNNVLTVTKHFAPPGGAYSQNTSTIIGDLDYITCRGTVNKFNNTPSPDLYQLGGYPVTRNDTASTLIAHVQKAIRLGTTVFFIFHQIVETPSNEYHFPYSEFTQFIDYVSSNIKCVDVDTWYNQLDNLRYSKEDLNRTSVVNRKQRILE